MIEWFHTMRDYRPSFEGEEAVAFEPGAPKEKKPKATPAATANADSLVGQPCPLCGKGTIIKGKTAYGCSEWKNGCTYRKAL